MPKTNFVGFLVETMTSKSRFEINWPLSFFISMASSFRNSVKIAACTLPNYLKANGLILFFHVQKFVFYCLILWNGCQSIWVEPNKTERPFSLQGCAILSEDGDCLTSVWLLYFLQHRMNGICRCCPPDWKRKQNPQLILSSGTPIFYWVFL